MQEVHELWCHALVEKQCSRVGELPRSLSIIHRAYRGDVNSLMV